MQELSDQGIQELDEWERYVCLLIKQVLHGHDTVDNSRTRFLRYDLPRYWYGGFFRPRRVSTGTTVVCEIRRTDRSLLDLDIVFSECGPRLDAGPPPDVVPERWELEYRLWEPDLADFVVYFNQVQPFLRDWLDGRLTLTTKYFRKEPYCWILRRDKEVIGKRCDRFLRLAGERRIVTQHT